ncbi:MAG: altronate dehydratase [Chloroflexi bacterium]|nr:altronate dehydratase [Chloroflexota bacterium]
MADGINSGVIQISGLAVSAEPVELDKVAIRLHPDDDVAVATADLPPRMTIAGPWGDVRVAKLVQMGHKVALRSIPSGGAVHRYGQIIGFATHDIAPGDHVHSHNLGVQEFSRDPDFGIDVRPVDFVPESARRTFMGYLRSDGRVGTRNYIAVISTVNCSATVTRRVADRFRDRLHDQYPNVDGVIPLVHKAGCGARYGGPEVDQLQRTLAGFAHHPNVGGYLIIGLGCEINQVQDLVTRQGLDSDRPPLFVIQDEGGLAETVEAGVRAVESLLPKVNEYRRTEQSAEHLVVALQCGGSDGWSGVTANPALGLAADEMVRQGGTVVLGETTEVYGAEHLLTRRAATVEAGNALLERIRWWEQHTAALGCEIDNNPSPGNKAGGLTTIYEKSLGAVAKSGSTPLNAVYKYADRITAKGFVHMDTPGYDPVSVTGQVAGGCNIVVFTTGRGSVFGFKPAPSIKLATNPSLYRKMESDMDVNAGRVLEGATLAEVGNEIFERILAVASGEPSKSEAQGAGEEEFNPWIIGATL